MNIYLSCINVREYTSYLNTCRLFMRRRQWHPTPILVPGKSHGWSSLVGCSPWGREELDTTERLHCHFSLSCMGEGNGNPVFLCGESQGRRSLVGYCLWGSKSRTRLKQLSSSSMENFICGKTDLMGP